MKLFYAFRGPNPRFTPVSLCVVISMTQQRGHSRRFRTLVKRFHVEGVKNIQRFLIQKWKKDIVELEMNQLSYLQAESLHFSIQVLIVSLLGILPTLLTSPSTITEGVPKTP
jgi:hypothetical protein